MTPSPNVPREQLDMAYTERAHLVAALSKLFPASIEQHLPIHDETDWDMDWLNVVIVDLPTGQASWHVSLTDLHLYDHLPRNAGRTWDGHTTPEKYARLAALTGYTAERDERRMTRQEVIEFMRTPYPGKGEKE